MNKTIAEKLLSRDGIDRRGFLECMTWAGTGVLWAMKGDVAFGQETHHATAHDGLTFVQISDSHIGFNKAANENVIGTLQEAVARINALHAPPAFLIHTGDISHLSKPEEFDAADQILKTANVGQVFFVPGEHDVLGDNGKQYLERYGRQTKGDGWFSFDQRGVHFIGLVNVMNLKAGGLGSLGNEQLEWLENDAKDLTQQYTDCRICSCPAVGGVSGLGLGHGRQRARNELSETLRLRHRAERPHSPDHAEGGGQHHVPHRHLDGVSSTQTRRSAITWSYESPHGTTTEPAGTHPSDLRQWPARAGHRGFLARAGRHGSGHHSGRGNCHQVRRFGQRHSHR